MTAPRRVQAVPESRTGRHRSGTPFSAAMRANPSPPGAGKHILLARSTSHPGTQAPSIQKSRFRRDISLTTNREIVFAVVLYVVVLRADTRNALLAHSDRTPRQRNRRARPERATSRSAWIRHTGYDRRDAVSRVGAHRRRFPQCFAMSDSDELDLACIMPGTNRVLARSAGHRLP